MVAEVRRIRKQEAAAKEAEEKKRKELLGIKSTEAGKDHDTAKTSSKTGPQASPLPASIKKVQ